MTLSDSAGCSTANLTKVLVADSHHLFRAGLGALLSCEPDIEIVGEAATGHEAVAWAVKACANVVVIDARLPVNDGFRVAADLRRVHTGPDLGAPVGPHRGAYQTVEPDLAATLNA